MTEIRKIKYDGEWRFIDDIIKIKEDFRWYLPIKITREYRIFFIGEDGGADVVLKNSKMPINCPENISFAASKGHVKTIFGAVDITKYN